MNENEIRKRIARAPEPLRTRLKRLHKDGLLTDTKLKQAFIQAARRAQVQPTHIHNQEGVQNPPSNPTSLNLDNYWAQILPVYPIKKSKL